jgi:TldD protein
MDRRKIGQLALDQARLLGVEYADIRIEKIENQSLSISTGTLAPIDYTTSYGIGIRVIKDGAWGFAATDDLTEKSIKEKTELAVSIAKASAMVNNKPVALAPLEPSIGQYVTSHEIYPFTVPLDEKINFLMEIDNHIAQTGGGNINSRSVFAEFEKVDKYFASSDGADISQLLIRSGAGMSLGVMKSHRERYERSYPSSSGQYECKGYELLTELKMKDAVPRLVEEVSMMSSAEPCPEKTTTLLLSGDQVSLQIHESIGHALELDRVFGAERNFSGVSFATTDKLGSLKYGSDIVTVVSNPAIPHGLASYGYDDEGVPAEKAELIKDGILVDYLSSRETAARIGRKSTGAMRANSWSNVPIVRITSLLLQPGDSSFEQILASIDDGIYMDGVRSWSIDDERRYFHFGCEIGWLIQGGKLTTPIKNPTYSGCTTEFWNNCSAIANTDSYRVWGTPNCGKGQPGQNARTAQGASPTRFDNVEVGG